MPMADRWLPRIPCALSPSAGFRSLLPRELRSSLRPETLNIKTVFARLKEKGDLWADFWKRRQRLEQAIELLSERMPPRTKKTP